MRFLMIILLVIIACNTCTDAKANTVYCNNKLYEHVVNIRSISTYTAEYKGEILIANEFFELKFSLDNC